MDRIAVHKLPTEEKMVPPGPKPPNSHTEDALPRDPGHNLPLVIKIRHNPVSQIRIKEVVMITFRYQSSPNSLDTATVP